MSWWRRVVGRWQLEDALDAELRYHFDRLVDDYVASGLSERDARRRAREEFGGVEDVKDACRDAWGTRWVHDLAADLKFAARMLGRERAFTVAAVLALALGIGVNTTLFTIANAICLRGLPIDAVDRVVDIRTRDDRGRPQPLSVAEFDAIRGARAPALAGVAAYTTRRATLRDADRAAERITVASVTADTFALIRQQPSFGRTFRADEDVSVGRVVMLGAEIWRTRYSGDAGLIGRSVLIDGTPTTVIGIMPHDFKFPDNADAWQPLSAVTLPRDMKALTVLARLADHSSVAHAQDVVATILADRTAARTAAPRPTTSVTPIDDRYRGNITDPVWIAFLTAGLLVVLIACANVANLLLASGVRRTRELTLRLSLGATRSRVVRQLLAETAMLALLGGLAGLAVAVIGLRLFTTALPANGLPYWISFAMDWRVFASLAFVCAGTIVLAGLAPAVQHARIDVSAAIKDTSGTISGSPGLRRWTSLFLTVQLAFTVVLLCAVGITVQSFYVLQYRGPRIDARHLLTFTVALPPGEYRTPQQRRGFFDTLEQRLLGTKAVTAMTVATTLPANPGVPRRVSSDRVPVDAPPVATTSIDEHYFATLGLSVLSGRAFTADDIANERAVAIVNQRFAELFSPGEAVVGSVVRLGGRGERDSAGAGDTRTIVGVVPSIRSEPTLHGEPRVYLPLAAADLSAPSVLLRVPGDPAAIVPFVREEVRRLDPDLPVERVATLEDANWQARWNARVSFGLIASIACVALVLATIGLGALTAQAVTQRTRELGIRLALGAAPISVVLLVLRRTLVQVGVGLLAGALGARAWARVFGSRELAAVANFAGVAVLVAIVTLSVAAFIARRAARIDPLAAIRCE